MRSKNYLTYFGNTLINVDLPENSEIFYPNPPMEGIPRHEVPEATRNALENPVGMLPLREQVNSRSRILILFDDNCQPFPPTKKPDFRQLMIETLIEMLYSYGVPKERIELMCAVALHRKMKPHELEFMLGSKLMKEFYPAQLRNFDAEDVDKIVELEPTEKGEIVETDQAVLECDLIIYVDTIQIPLNGGHKSVAVGLGTYRSISAHHSPHMTENQPHVMQPHGSNMHSSIERISRQIEKQCKIMVVEAAMNSATYPFPHRHLGKPNESCNFGEKIVKSITPSVLKTIPEPLRFRFFKSIPSDYNPMMLKAGTIDGVHPSTTEILKKQLTVNVPRQFKTLVFGLPDLSPYSVGARINPVLVVSDVLGYVFNWFYNKPLIEKNGVVIILNPTFEVFHKEYHYGYELFYREVLSETNDPFEMQKMFQEKYATDPLLIDRYRNHYAHHGFHPFTVWYWATYPLKYLSKVILVGPKDDRVAKKLGVDWAKNLEHALGMAREVVGEDDVAALTMPPFLYVNIATR